MLWNMDKELRWRQWHFAILLATFIASSAVIWVSNDRRQTAFEATVSVKFAYQDGFNQGMKADIGEVRKTANEALSDANTALTLLHEGNKK